VYCPQGNGSRKANARTRFNDQRQSNHRKEEESVCHQTIDSVPDWNFHSRGLNRWFDDILIFLFPVIRLPLIVEARSCIRLARAIACGQYTNPLANRGWRTSLGLNDLRSAFLAWNSRPLAAVKEMPIASAVSRIERSCSS